MSATQLSLNEMRQAAHTLNIEPCAMWAVCTVESAGNGFLPSGQPKILFEGHIFWRELKKRGINPDSYAKDFPRVLYPHWTKAYYLGGESEHSRLQEAMQIDEEAAQASASWGAFQILGCNYAACGYATVRQFVDAQKESAASQLQAFCGFIHANNLVRHLAGKNWAAFARGYNGPSYEQNRYDQKLAEAYANCLKRHGPTLGNPMQEGAPLTAQTL